MLSVLGRQSPASSAEHSALPPQRIPAHDIARGAIATDQIIKIVAADQSTAHAPGRGPDYLGIMGDIAPMAGGAVFGKQAVFIQAIFLDP